MKLQLQPIFAGLAALLLIAIVGYLAIIGQTIDSALAGGLGLSLGYLFGRPDVPIGPTAPRDQH